jgi:BolA family transcriptional regulator, general stress-responsive regulator
VLDRRLAPCPEEEMRVAETIRTKLIANFAPEELSVEDESARHAGHAGARAEGETHFRVRIVSSSFAGLSRVDRQRRIYEILAEELRGPVHALALSALTPEEVKRG